jgi:O-antigen/teichoic acid export membrane protein
MLMAADAAADAGKAGSGPWWSRLAAFWRRPGQVVRRLGWGVADQAVSSLTNFAVSIYVFRTLGAVQFGAFSLAYVTYAFALTASRGLATDPLLVRFSATDRATWRRAVANCTGTATAVGLATGACVLVAAAVLHGTASEAFLALGLTLPGLLLQDSWRYSFFAIGRGVQAFLNDMVWALALLPALVLVQVTGHENVFWFVLAWGAPAAVAAAVGPFQAGVIPRLTGAWTWLSRHRDLAPRYFAEGGIWSVVSQLRTYGIGLILGLAALGYVQAANTLMGPLTILWLGMSLVAIPEAARVLRSSPLRLPLFCLLLSGALAAAALAWGIVLLVALPKGLGAAVLGSSWRPTYPLVLLQTVYFIGQIAGVGSFAGLHALGAARRSLRSMIIVSVTYLACSLAGAAVGGTIGTMRGAAAAAWIGMLISWWQFRAALRESDQVPAGARLWPGRKLGRHRRSRAGRDRL